MKRGKVEVWKEIFSYVTNLAKIVGTGISYQGFIMRLTDLRHWQNSYRNTSFTMVVLI